MATKGFLEYAGSGPADKEQTEETPAPQGSPSLVGVKRKKSSKKLKTSLAGDDFSSLSLSSAALSASSSSSSSGGQVDQEETISGSGGGGGHEVNLKKAVNKVVDKIHTELGEAKSRIKNVGETMGLPNLANSLTSSSAFSPGGGSSGGGGASSADGNGTLGSSGEGAGEKGSSKKKHNKHHHHHHHSGSSGHKIILTPQQAEALHTDTSKFMDLVLEPGQKFAASLFLSINAQKQERVNEQRAIVSQFIPFLSHFGCIENLLDRLLAIRTASADESEDEEASTDNNPAGSLSPRPPAQPLQKLLSPSSIESVIITCYLQRAEPLYWNSVWGSVQKIVDGNNKDSGPILSPRCGFTFVLKPSDFDPSVTALVQSFLSILRDSLDQISGTIRHSLRWVRSKVESLADSKTAMRIISSILFEILLGVGSPQSRNAGDRKRVKLILESVQAIEKELFAEKNFLQTIPNPEIHNAAKAIWNEDMETELIGFLRHLLEHTAEQPGFSPVGEESDVLTGAKAFRDYFCFHLEDTWNSLLTLQPEVCDQLSLFALDGIRSSSLEIQPSK